MTSKKKKITIRPIYLQSCPGSSMKDVTFEKNKVDLCDMIFIDKNELINENQNYSNLEDGLLVKMNKWLQKTYPQYKFYYKKSSSGNYVFWKNEEVFLETKSNLLSAGKRNKQTAFQYSKGYHEDSYDDAFEDDYDDVALCDEFDRDELDPDLAEAWDESYRNTYHRDY